MKRGIYIMNFLILIILSISFISAGWFDDFRARITGRAGDTSTVTLNITVTSGAAPVITVFNNTMSEDIFIGPDEAPSITTVTINFSAVDAQGYTNINDSSALINFTKSGEDTRQVSCSRIVSESSGNEANYTCAVEMHYWDGSGTWNIGVSISDINQNDAINTDETFSVGSTTGFVSSPSTMAWSGGIAPGAINEQADELILLNNTGNTARNLEVNATSLLGETNNALGLWAGNFTVKNAAGCDGTAMSQSVFTAVGSTSLPEGNFTINDGSTGQEQLYICLEEAGTELSAQAYSTGEQGSWTIEIVS
jgi:hypothetical protein